MLPKENRVRQDFDFKLVRKKGKRYSTPYFSFFVLKKEDDSKSPSQFGFVVSTKVDKRATKRNRIKRTLRDEVSKTLPKIKPGYLGAFWVGGRARDAQEEDLRSQVGKALRKSGLVEK